MRRSPRISLSSRKHPIGFSEFSYGYGAIREAEAFLVAAGQAATKAPLLPNLRIEHRLGYDAQLTHAGYVLLLQFKLPEYVSRRHPMSPTWDAAGAPHLRVSIDTASKQHATFLQLASTTAQPAIGTRMDVLYLAPDFWGITVFDDVYTRGEILDNSSAIEPRLFGHDGSIHHHVVNASTGDRLMLSEPEELGARTHWRTYQAIIADRIRTSGLRPVRLEELAIRVENFARDRAGLLRVELPHDVPPISRLRNALAVLGVAAAVLPMVEGG
jgi:hypothetical protein